MTYIAGTNASAARNLTRPGVQQARFPFLLLSALACDEFCALTDMHQRAEWMQAHGIQRPPTAALVRAARKYLASRKART